MSHERSLAVVVLIFLHDRSLLRLGSVPAAHGAKGVGWTRWQARRRSFGRRLEEVGEDGRSGRRCQRFPPSNAIVLEFTFTSRAETSELESRILSYKARGGTVDRADEPGGDHENAEEELALRL